MTDSEILAAVATLCVIGVLFAGYLLFRAGEDKAATIPAWQEISTEWRAIAAARAKLLEDALASWEEDREALVMCREALAQAHAAGGDGERIWYPQDEPPEPATSPIVPGEVGAETPLGSPSRVKDFATIMAERNARPA